MKIIKNKQYHFLCALYATLVLPISGGTTENINKFQHLMNPPQESDGIVFFWGECANNDYTPQPIRAMGSEEHTRFVAETFDNNMMGDSNEEAESGTPQIVIQTHDTIVNHSLNSISRTVDTHTIFSYTAYESSNVNFIFRCYLLSQTAKETRYVLKYSVDGEMMPAKEIVYQGEDYLPVLHFNQMHIYIMTKK